MTDYGEAEARFFVLTANDVDIEGVVAVRSNGKRTGRKYRRFQQGRRRK